MATNILTQQVNNDKQHNSVNGRNASFTPSWADLIRHERTAGGLAVMDSIREDREDNGGEASFPALSPANAIPKTLNTRLVGFAKLKALLRPVHKFFSTRRGFIQRFRSYDDSGESYTRRLIYPKVCAEDRLNPYRRYQLNNKASARTFKRIQQFVEVRKFDDFQVASLVFTMPKFMSEYLASQGDKGRDMAWRLYKGLWAEDLPVVIKQDIQLAAHTNLHLWRTEKPFEPHYHFHVLIPNYGLKDTGALDENDEPALEFARWNWSRQRGGREVPFSDEQLNQLKQLWLNRLARFCRRHGLEFREAKIDIFVEYIDNWVKLHHRFNYNGRHWTENYAEYSNKNIDCPDPPAWLLNYQNKARVFGWWTNLKNITTESEEKEKISPYTGNKMAYVWDCANVDTLVNYAGGILGNVEFCKGKPFEAELTDEDITWLKGVMDPKFQTVNSFYQGAAEILKE